MTNTIRIFIKYQKNYLFFLVSIFVLPLALFFQFSTIELPNVQYVFLGVLFVSQFLYYSEKKFHRKIRAKVAKTLQNELKKNPSNQEVFSRSLVVEFHRNISIAMTAFCIFALMIYFQKF